MCNCLLTTVSIPKCHIGLDCVKDVCNEHCHYIEINNYYKAIINYMTDKCILSTPDCPSSYYNVPGWSDFASEKHDLAREAFLDWIALGKPHNGAAICRMRRTRAAFKLALSSMRRKSVLMRVLAPFNLVIRKNVGEMFLKYITVRPQTMSLKFESC